MRKNWDSGMRIKNNKEYSGWHLRSSTPEAERLFEGRCLLEIHSVYHQVVNLTDGETIYSLHPAHLARTPMSLILEPDGWSMEDLELRQGMQVELLEDCMFLNGIQIDCRERSLWDPKITTSVSYGKIRQILSGIRRILPDFQDRGGFSDSFICSKQETDDFMTRALRSCFWEFQRNCSKPEEMIQSLIGMGYGLTPSGDDFLVGLLYLICISGCMEQQITKNVIDVVQKNLHRTNDLSRQFLKHACKGEFGEKFHELLQAVCRGEDGIREICQIAGTGHSSGIDALHGIAAGWRMLKECAEKN